MDSVDAEGAGNKLIECEYKCPAEIESCLSILNKYMTENMQRIFTKECVVNAPQIKLERP